MGTVTALVRSDAMTLGDAVTAYLATLVGEESRGTRRTYSTPLRALVAEYGAATGADLLAEREFAAWFTNRWGGKSPSTWNVSLDAHRSAFRYWRDQGWLTGDPSALLRRRGRAPDRTRSLDRTFVESLLTREDIPIREKTLWTMLYESAARSSEVLRLDVAELDMPNRKSKVRRKAGAVDVITWRTATARLLPRLLKGRRTGPVFLTDRRARVELPPCDIDPASGRARLSYRQAEAVFSELSGGKTLHQWRHAALTHAAEDGASTATLLAYSGHTSVVSLARYARVSPEALGQWQAQRDPASRRRGWR
jgi:integrase/recombinase XerC/integrase/recombinase XerD